MFYPNIECYYLCVWMLTISKQRLTGPQITNTTLIRDAALAQTNVTETEWNNFNSYAAWRNPYYIVYRDYQASQVVDLLTSLNNYYKFEGNSNDEVGGLNGTDTDVTYNSAYGKIGQGVKNNSTSSKIIFGGVSDFSFIQNNGLFTLNIWMNPTVSASNYRLWSTAQTTAQKGFHTLFTTQSTGQTLFLNGSSGASYTSYLVHMVPFLTNVWQMFTLCGDGTYIYGYLNGLCVFKIAIQTLSTGNSQAGLYLFNLIGNSGSATMYLDEFGVWSRCLNLGEIYALYNGGAGLQYPF